jgi:hypothetical protein
VEVGSPRWLSMQVRWAPTGTIVGAGGNEHGHEQECNIVRA